MHWLWSISMGFNPSKDMPFKKLILSFLSFSFFFFFDVYIDYNFPCKKWSEINTQKNWNYLSYFSLEIYEYSLLKIINAGSNYLCQLTKLKGMKT